MVSENMREQISDGLPSAMYITASVHKTHLITSKKLENLMDSSESIDNARHAVEDDRGHDTARSTKLSGHC
jgi:hypothetical protein